MASQKTVSGKIVSEKNSDHAFNSGDLLNVSVIDGSRMDAASITLGEQTVALKAGQKFPIAFNFTYDLSLATPGANRILVSADIKDQSGKLLYNNQTATHVQDNVEVNVEKVLSSEEIQQMLKGQ